MVVCGLPASCMFVSLSIVEVWLTSMAEAAINANILQLTFCYGAVFVGSFETVGSSLFGDMFCTKVVACIVGYIAMLGTKVRFC